MTEEDSWEMVSDGIQNDKKKPYNNAKSNTQHKFGNTVSILLGESRHYLRVLKYLDSRNP